MVSRDSGRLVTIIKEYTDLLDSFTTRVREAASTDRRMGNISRQSPIVDVMSQRVFYERLKPALLETARAVSQLLMHGAVSGVKKVELELRLAHLEAAIELADRTLDMAFESVHH